MIKHQFPVRLTETPSKLIDGGIPDLDTPFGEAWRVHIPKLEAALNVRPSQHALIAAWLFHAPWAHPLWENYAISCIHLREIDGLRSPRLMADDMTHEIVLAALHPGETIPLYSKSMNFALRPFNFVAQFRSNDLDADLRLERAVSDVMDGRLNPDTDHLRQWMALFNSHS